MRSINRINLEICASKVRLTGIDGEQIGIVSLNHALEKAEEAGVDLVEISPNADPPVCRIMDYGKFIYEKNKSTKEQKKKQKIIQVKEIKFRPSIHENDYQIKIRNLIRFLEDGDKVKITLRFRGREMAHQKIGLEIIHRIRKDLSNIALVESLPSKIEARQIMMVLAPKKK
ncbi:translation initiation factor IF-3 [Candidatus Palibaumannia cicadellinicola]|uniref:Translation initiation factor IF-3 n=2 Tax=Candidatus Palibaumannia cicadellinicola TaxID=186490 RepID=A0A2N4XWS4_9GAMM|nr:translation initiation factor IF-3 [Candidatus Baumannia cicadellinicola]